MRKIVLFVLMAVICLSFGLTAKANEAAPESGEWSFGGHMRMYFYDNVSGETTYDGVKDTNTQVAGGEFSSHSFIFFIQKSISEKVSIMAAPDFALGSSGATPSLGKKIGEQRATPNRANAPNAHRFNQLWVKYDIPEYQLELKAGYLNVMHTWDYGLELFWMEQLNGTKFSCDSNLAAWHDLGVEAYRAFEFGNVSLPVWAYLLNGKGGNQALDNNTNKTIMVHTEPEFGGSLDGLKALVSYGFGNWGDEDYTNGGGSRQPAELKGRSYYRWAVGAMYDFEGLINVPLSARFEAAGFKQEDKWTGSDTDQGYSGYYLKVFYRIMPDKLTAMLGLDVANKEVSATKNEEYNTTILALQYDLAPEATVILQIDIMDWSNDNSTPDEIAANRVALGMRITF
jgi:hypothetical protein